MFFLKYPKENVGIMFFFVYSKLFILSGAVYQ